MVCSKTILRPRDYLVLLQHYCSFVKKKKYEGSRGFRHTIVGLAWRRRHIFIVNSDNCEGLPLFVCAMDYRVLVAAFKVCFWEPPRHSDATIHSYMTNF